MDYFLQIPNTWIIMFELQSSKDNLVHENVGNMVVIAV